MDEGNGFLFMRARYYDTGVGRFISKDPIGTLGGFNLYGYVGNNPILLSDPNGLVPVVLPALAACLASPPCAAALAALATATLYYAHKATYEILDLLSEDSWPWTRENTYETIGTPDYQECPEFKSGPGDRFKMCISLCTGRFSRHPVKRILCYAACGWGGFLESMRGMR